MKKFLIILLATIFCLALVACDGATESSGSQFTSESNIESGDEHETSSDDNSETSADDSSDASVEDSSETSPDDSSDTSSNGGNVVSPIQPGGDYNVGDGYGK